jgi:hypothetical protein
MRQHGVNLKAFKKQLVRREEDWAMLRRVAAETPTQE